MTDLSDFERPHADFEYPPFVQKQRAVQIVAGGERRTTGHVGKCVNRATYAFATERNYHKHRIRALDAYAISEDVLARLTGSNADWILIVEYDPDDERYTTLEYELRDYLDRATQVPEKYKQYEDDDQRFLPRDEARHMWAGHGPEDLYLPTTADVELKGDD